MNILRTASFTAVSLFALCSVNVAAVPTKGLDKNVEWSTRANWKLPAKPISFVHSLDGKKVFVLTENSKVNVFTPVGELLGSIAVDDGVTAIDIAPYGEHLFLINTKDNTFINLSVSLISKFEAGSSPYKGAVDAPVIITLFTDFE